MTQRVAAGSTSPDYCDEPPFHPDEAYPELAFTEVSSQPNMPYRLLRNLLRDLRRDVENFGRASWNPLGGVVEPGQTVLIKPNFVLHYNMSGDDVFAVITHPSVIRALVDYTYVALKGEGRIIVADAPLMNCDWDALMKIQRLDAVQSFYGSKLGFDIDVLDLRSFDLIDPGRPAYYGNRRQLSGDPLGEVVVDLGLESEFCGLAHEDYYGADYDTEETRRHHCGETQEYCVSRTVLSADTVISVPKMKTHQKVGVTLNLKGLVGINTNKNYLVHYRVGTPSEGGDQLPDGCGRGDRAVFMAQQWVNRHAMSKKTAWGDRVYQAASAIHKKCVSTLWPMSSKAAAQHAGGWYGNDSAWRMTADLAKILFFADSDGRLHSERQRHLFCVVDGIVGGEGNGPLETTARRAGFLVVGENPFAVDMATARLMGFDVERIRQFSVLSDGERRFEISSRSEIEVILNGHEIRGNQCFDPSWRSPLPGFRPHVGWIGHIEVQVGDDSP